MKIHIKTEWKSFQSKPVSWLRGWNTLPCCVANCFWRQWRSEYLKVLTGCDGPPCSALVRVGERDRQHTLLKKPLQLLYLLKVHEPEPPWASYEIVPVSSQDNQTSDAPVLKRCPVRATTKRANEKWNVWIQELKNRTNVVKLIVSIDTYALTSNCDLLLLDTFEFANPWLTTPRQ